MKFEIELATGIVDQRNTLLYDDGNVMPKQYMVYHCKYQRHPDKDDELIEKKALGAVQKEEIIRLAKAS